MWLEDTSSLEYQLDAVGTEMERLVEKKKVEDSSLDLMLNDLDAVHQEVFESVQISEAEMYDELVDQVADELNTLAGVIEEAVAKVSNCVWRYQRNSLTRIFFFCVVDRNTKRKNVEVETGEEIGRRTTTNFAK